MLVLILSIRESILICFKIIQGGRNDQVARESPAVSRPLRDGLLVTMGCTTGLVTAPWLT